MIAIIIGATGATGTALLKQLIIDDIFKKIIVFTRNPIKITSDKIEENLVDFNNIEKWSGLIKGDIIFSALGTTKKEAGGKDAQYLVDFTYQYNIARAGAENKVQKYIVPNKKYICRLN